MGEGVLVALPPPRARAGTHSPGLVAAGGARRKVLLLLRTLLGRRRQKRLQQQLAGLAEVATKVLHVQALQLLLLLLLLLAELLGRAASLRLALCALRLCADLGSTSSLLLLGRRSLLRLIARLARNQRDKRKENQ